MTTLSDLKTRLNYCEDQARSCEILIFCFPAQTEPLYRVRSQYR